MKIEGNQKAQRHGHTTGYTMYIEYRSESPLSELVAKKGLEDTIYQRAKECPGRRMAASLGR